MASGDDGHGATLTPKRGGQDVDQEQGAMNANTTVSLTALPTGRAATPTCRPL